MCLIIYAGKNTNKKDAFLEEAIRKAEEFNGDGMGFAVKKHNSNNIYLDKGYNDVDEFIKKIKAQRIGIKDELLIHLRIGNKGAKNAAMCHPFVVSDKEDEIVELETNTDKMIVAHNGTMHRHSVLNSSNSDTYFFIKNVMSKESIQRFLYDSPEDFDFVMQPHLNSSRLAIMKAGEKTVLLGNWYQENGLYFSKDYYVEYFPKPLSNVYDWRTGKYGYDQDWDDDFYYNMSAKNNDDDKSESLKDIIDSFDDSGVIKMNSLKHGVYCPLLDYDRPNFRDLFGYNYHYYLGLYLPEEDLSLKYIPAINKHNLNRFVITAKYSNKAYAIDRLGYYTISDCNNSSVTILDHSDDCMIKLSNEEFYNIFKVTPNSTWAECYNDLYRLIININVSKTMCKKLSKTIDSAIEKSSEYLSFKNLTSIDTDAAIMFMEFIKEELSYREEPHKLIF